MGKYRHYFEKIKILNKLKASIVKHGTKKIIEKAAIIAIIGVICLIAGSVLFEDTFQRNSGQEPAAAKNNQTAVEAMKQSEEATKQEIEKNLQSILSKIKGAGKVDVMITFYSGTESVPAYDEKNSDSSTQEKDKEGGSRSIQQSDKDKVIVFEESDGIKKPYILKEILPQVKGVVIVADGAGDAVVKGNLIKAAGALLEVASHKIQVFERNNN